jgi:hypothetical protein
MPRWRQLTTDSIAESTVQHFANDLRVVAKKNPTRFAKLALQLPDDIHPDYKKAILEGLKSTKPEKQTDPFEPADIVITEQVFDKFNLDFNDREVAIAYCRLIEERANENWSEKTIRRLIEYATEHEDPQPGQMHISCPDKSDSGFTIYDLQTNAINHVRGVAAQTMGSLLWKHPDLFNTLKDTLERLMSDDHPAVRVAAINACLPVLNIDKDFAVEQFLKAVQDDIRVAACWHSVDYFNCGMYGKKYRLELSMLILDMVNSEYDEVVYEGAKELYARHLFYGIFDKEVKQCIADGSKHQRKGVARVASSLFYQKDYTKKCGEILMSLFNDSEPEVRQKTRKVFHKPELLEVGDIAIFLDCFIQSESFSDDPLCLIDIFEKHTGSLVPFADILFKICEVFAGPLLEAVKSSRARLSYETGKMPTLILRLYDQARDNREIENKCLDIWDMFFEKQIGQTRDLTRAIER